MKNYQKKLPKLKEIRRLAGEIRNFPISGLGIVQYAEHQGYDDATVDFLKLFSARMIFNNKTDLVYHCSLLERLLSEEQSAAQEVTHNPQG